MEERIIQASFFVVGAFSFYTIFRLYSLIFKEPKKKWITIVSFIIGFFISTTVWYLQQESLPMMITNIVIYFFLSLNYDAKMSKRIILSLGSYGLFMLSETLIVIVFKISNMDILNNTYFQIWGSLLTTLTAYVVVSAVIQQKAIKAQSYYKARHAVFLCIIIFIIFGISFVLPYIGQHNVANMFIGVVALIFTAVFLFVFLDTMIVESQERVARTEFEMQSKLYSNELDMVKEYQYEIKTIRHNIDHHIQTLNDLLNKEEYEKAKAYLQGLTKVVNVNLTPIITSMPELDSILNLKLSQANQMSIQVNSTVKVEEACRIPPQSYISIIGNLMDNAIEAVEPIVEKAKRKFDISVGILKGIFFIEIMNPYLAEPIKEGVRYISTKGDKQEHGIGLAHVRDIVERRGGTIEIDDHYLGEQIFNIKVLLYNR